MCCLLTQKTKEFCLQWIKAMNIEYCAMHCHSDRVCSPHGEKVISNFGQKQDNLFWEYQYIIYWSGQNIFPADMNLQMRI